MVKRKSKRQQDIKAKLTAAICMLLVSTIMMVSSTYAWFTLSTAPEVTGIQTAVGANGNLEMALLPKDGLTSSITSAAGDSVLAVEAKNVTWGNLVDLSDTSIYGLDKITLYPAELNLTDAGKIATEAGILKTPQYGADGRVSQLATNTTTGYYDKQNTNFSPNEDMGVRAVGTASGMTDRQLSYRNARSAANTAAAMAANKASASLNNNGSSLANIAIEYGMGADTASFGKSDVEALRAIINDLNGEGGVLDQIEKAYMQYILAYAASAASGEADTVWQTVSGAVTADGATLDTVIAAIGEDSIPDAVKTGIDEYKGAVTDVDTADTALETLEAELATDAAATFTWNEIKTAMTPLANPAAMEINGFKADEVKENLGALVSSVTDQGGLKVIMNTGAGVYADIADQSGDYTASITIEKVEYNGIVLNNMKARMETKTSVNPTYLSLVGTAVENAGAPSSGSDTTLPISDMYGFIVDLAFRTNAAESNLLLQVDAADRIYDGNTNENTMGHGSSMTFMATTTDFGNDQVKGLMDSIVLVFFDPSDGTIYCYGGLDTANATVGTAGVTAEIYLYNITGNGTTYRPVQAGETATHKEVSTTTYEPATEGATHVWNETSNSYVTAGDGETATHKEVVTKTYEAATEGATHVAVEGTPTKTKIDTNEILALTQNQAQAVSVLVYLDGNTVTNADVAATGSTSMTGTMNLQFASSANLIPMEYANLHIPGASDGSGDAAATEYDVTLNGATGNAKATANTAYTFTLDPAAYTLGEVTVDGVAVNPTDNGDDSYTIPADKVTGAIVINTTAVGG